MTASLLVLDRSVRARRLMRRGLAATRTVEVICDTADVDVALRALLRRRPDVVCVDLSIPVEKLTPLLHAARARSLVVIGLHEPLAVFSTEVHAKLLRPAERRDASDEAAQYRAILEPLVLRLHGRRASALGVAPRPSPGRSEASTPILAPPRSHASGWRPSALLIGASTGGPEALNVLIPSLPVDFHVPVLVVQHMPAGITHMLAERLDRRSPLQVREGLHGAPLRAGAVWIAPGGSHMAVAGRGAEAVLRLRDDPPENSCRPAVDVLFRTAARSFGGRVIAVVLTGMGHDGAAGAQAVRDAGGEVFVQDEESSVVWGMPGAVVRRRLADRVLSLASLPTAILERCARPLVGVGT